MDLLPHQQAMIDKLIASGTVQRGDFFLSMPRRMGRATILKAVQTAMVAYQTPPGADPTATAEELIRHGADIDHIDDDGVITFVSDVDPNPEPHNARGLNTDDFSQAPTIDADRSAAWNRKAKTVKPGSFAARRMANEE